MADGLAIRELRDDERAWAVALYHSIDFAPTPPGSVALVAERAGARIGLGRLVRHAPGVAEMGGIWTDEAARGGGVARAMVTALLARRDVVAGPGSTLWCIPFVHLTAFYRSFGFTDAPRPWPPEIAAKVADCVAHAQDVAVLAL
jgi:GNAT superfamily N-acetyltransferase